MTLDCTGTDGCCTYSHFWHWQISNLFLFILPCIRQPVLDIGLPYFPIPVLLKLLFDRSCLIWEGNKLACNWEHHNSSFLFPSAILTWADKMIKSWPRRFRFPSYILVHICARCERCCSLIMQCCQKSVYMSECIKRKWLYKLLIQPHWQAFCLSSTNVQLCQ